MSQTVHLFETQTLAVLQSEREEALKKLKMGGRPARERIHLEDKVRRLTARVIEIETHLGLGRRQ